MIYVFAKLLILFIGLFNTFIGSILILLDARFHFMSDLKTLKTQSPDWIIFNYFFDKPGLSEITHKIMAILLALLAITYFIIWGCNLRDKYSLYVKIYEFIMRFTLLIISLGILLKNIILQKQGDSVAFL
jgi:hypothetical protein